MTDKDLALVAFETLLVILGVLGAFGLVWHWFDKKGW